jgi:glyoxylase-like metal-dependent hydrolase (beta-lactamase superfamily II)
MIVEQFLLGGMENFVYMVGCERTGEAAVIDPGPESEAERLAGFARDKGLAIRYIFNTHYHWDHTSGNERLKRLTGAEIVMHRDDAAMYNGTVDIRLDSEGQFQLGDIALRIYHTPGHSPGGICIYAQGRLFTGDTLFVGDSGRTDLAGGHRPTLGASIRRLMQELPDDTVVCPGHHYGPTRTSTLAWERRNNVNAEEYGFAISG